MKSNFNIRKNLAVLIISMIGGILLFPTPVSADTLSVSIGKVFHCPGNNIQVPVTVKDFNDVNGFSLEVKYGAGLVYTTMQNVNPLLQAGTLVVTPGFTSVGITYFDPNAVTVANGKLFDLIFTSNPGNYPIFFDTVGQQTSFQNLVLGQLPFKYEDGFINDINGTITSQPQNAIAGTGMDIKFAVSSSGYPAFQWQVSVNGGGVFNNINNNVTYNGVNNDTLVIHNCQPAMAGYMYRCVLSYCNPPVTNSNAAVLDVVSPLIIQADTVAVCPGGIATVKVRAWNFTNMASVSLKFNFDPTSIQYLGVVNVNPLMQGFYVANVNLNEFDYAFFSLNPITIQPGDILFEVRFQYITDSSAISWIPASTGLNPEPVVYINGLVYDGSALIVTQPVNDTVGIGDTALFSTVVGGIFPANYSFQWQESTNGGLLWNNLPNNNLYIGVSTPVLTIIGVGASMDGNQYRCRVAGVCNPLFTSPASLHLLAHIQGTLTYVNAQSTPLANCIIQLIDGVNVSLQTTDSLGRFDFLNLQAGTYELIPTCSKPWGGVNAADALLALQYFVGNITLSPWQIVAADVDGSQAVNALDALRILRRFVGQISSFPIDDWQLEHKTVVVSNAPVPTVHLHAICAGDVDGSYIPQ